MDGGFEGSGNVDFLVEVLGVGLVLRVDGIVGIIEGDVGLSLTAAHSQIQGIFVHLRAWGGNLLLLEVNNSLLATGGASEFAEDDTLTELGAVSGLHLLCKIVLTGSRVLNVGVTVGTGRLLVSTRVALVALAVVLTAILGWGSVGSSLPSVTVAGSLGTIPGRSLVRSLIALVLEAIAVLLTSIDGSVGAIVAVVAATVSSVSLSLGASTVGTAICAAVSSVRVAISAAVSVTVAS